VEIGEPYRLPLPVKALKAQPRFADVPVEKPMVSSVRLPGGRQVQAEMSGVQKDTRAPLPAELVSVRCPQCRKLLAKCAVYGTIEIVCTRCKAVVRQIFAEFVPEELRSF
jgi:phage FluMu protein Com